jgi:hypothetical protein
MITSSVLSASEVNCNLWECKAAFSGIKIIYWRGRAGRWNENTKAVHSERRIQLKTDGEPGCQSVVIPGAAEAELSCYRIPVAFETNKLLSAWMLWFGRLQLWVSLGFMRAHPHTPAWDVKKQGN